MGAQRVYVFDADYFDIHQYHVISHSDNVFVTKLHGNIKPYTVCTPPAPTEPLINGYVILEDRYVTLSSDDTRWYRCVCVRLPTIGKIITILTNLLWLSVEQVRLLYHYRWFIEIVFRHDLRSQLNSID